MKAFKIVLLCIIPILGIYSMDKMEFAKKLVIMLPGVAPGPRPGGPQGPPPQMGQDRPEAAGPGGEQEMRPAEGEQEMRPAEGEHEIQPAEGTQGEGIHTTSPGSEVVSQAPPARPGGEEQSKWKIRINFNRGIKNVAYLTLILAFLIELTYLADRLIRRKALV